MLSGNRIVLGRASILFVLIAAAWRPIYGEPQPAVAEVAGDVPQVEVGGRIYREGVLSSGELISGTVQGDITVTGGQVVCGACHRRSGLGSMEGQEVVPAVTGDLLYQPLRLPTSKLPLAPLQRPAYTDETLKLAIRDGIGASGEALSPFMPRYALSDSDLDSLVAYLKTLRTDPDPGVGDRDIHFATIVSDSVDAATRKAFLDVFDAFVTQKNAETRHESNRAAHAPWHKKWLFEPYRKWVLHVWELKGPRASWPAQLQAQYEAQPVFAVLSGVVPGSWQPVHDFCEQNEIPCLFPVTDLPVIDEQSFYTVYLSQGMTLEADTVARHLSDDGLLSLPVVQVYAAGDPRGEAAAEELRRRLEKQGARVKDFRMTDDSALTEEFWRTVLEAGDGGTAVLWLDPFQLADLWQMKGDEGDDGPARLYLSTTLYGTEPGQMPPAMRARTYLVHPYEIPSKLGRLLARSTGWFKAKRIYAPDAQVAQANAYLALKMAGGAVIGIRGFFVRDYLLERIEHMVDRAPYTSVYPRISLAPGQRFVSRGAYVAQFQSAGSEGLSAVTDWLVPGSH